MPQVALGARALADVVHLFDFVAQRDALAARAAIDSIFDAIEVLARHPLIGWPVEGPLRELVISFGEAVYVALYRFRPRLGRVEVLAVRHQKEVGYG
jgi:plasmid stabilization system protein ParE